MSQSVAGPIIAVKSTFDPAGIVAAKAGMRELSQTKVGGGMGATSAPAPSRSSIADDADQVFERTRTSFEKYQYQVRKIDDLHKRGAISADTHHRALAQSAQKYLPKAQAIEDPLKQQRQRERGEADQVFESTRTASEKYEYQIRRLDDLHKKGAISTDTYRRAQKQAAAQLPKSAGIMEKLGVGDAAKTIAGASGLGGVTSALGAAGAVAGIAVAGVAIYGLTQAAAANAQAVKHSALTLGVSTSYYAGVEKAARSAGIEMSEVTEGFSKFAGRVKGAATGEDIGSAIYLQSLGVSQGDLQAGIGSPESLVNRVGGLGRGALFGSYRAAEAAAAATRGGGGLFDQDADADYAAAKMRTGVSNFGTKAVAGLYVAPGLLSSHGTQGERDILRNERMGDESRERWVKWYNSMVEGGTKTLPGIASAGVMEDYTNKSRAGFIYSNDQAQNEKYRKLSEVQTHETRIGQDAPYMNARAVARERISDSETKQANGGYTFDIYGERDRANIRAAQNEQLRGVRSNRENLQADIGSSAERWGIENQRRNQQKDADDLDIYERSPGGYRAVGPIMPEQRDNARGLGDQLTDYADNITRSGPLAGANGINTVAGYSQVVGAEYGMDQSKDTLKMVELLVKIAENTGKMTKEQGDAVLSNLGFRTADPIMGM